MLVTEIVVTLLISGGFGWIAKKLDKVEEKVDLLEDDLIRLSTNIEKRAENVRRPRQEE